jgi:hypothetical protein
MLDAQVGNHAEMKSLQRFVPTYYEVVLDWLSKRGLLKTEAGVDRSEGRQPSDR